MRRKRSEKGGERGRGEKGDEGRRRDRKRRMMLALNLWYLGTPRGGDRKEMPKGTQKGFRHFILLS